MDTIQSIPQALAAVPTASKEDFLNQIVEHLSSYEWPEGAIECINPDNVRLVYLWGNRFKGTAEGTWSARSGSEVTLDFGGDKKSKIAQGTPYSGEMPKLEFDLVAINDNQDLPYWAQPFVDMSFRSENFQPVSFVEQFGATIAGSCGGNNLSSWMKNGNRIIDNHFLPEASVLASDTAIAYLALGILPANTPMEMLNSLSSMGKFNAVDVQTTMRSSITEEPVPALIPFYLLEFQYQGQQYHLVMMADSRCMLHGKVPPVQGGRPSVDELVDKEAHGLVLASKILRWGWILAVLLLFASFKVAFFVLVLWLVAYLVVKGIVNSKKKVYEAQHSRAQQAIADMLRRQLLR